MIKINTSACNACGSCIKVCHENCLAIDNNTLNRNKKFKSLIGLKKNEKIFGTITLGYAAITFRNKVLGKKINIQWNAS